MKEKEEKNQEEAAAQILIQRGIFPHIAVPIAQAVVRSRQEPGFFWLITMVTDLWAELNKKAGEKRRLRNFSDKYGED